MNTPIELNNGDLLIPSLGFDPGLRHGAVVSSLFLFPQGVLTQCRLVKYQVCFRWTKASEWAIGERTPLARVRAVCSEIIRCTPSGPAPLAVDYDPESVRWSSRKMQMMQTAYFVAYLTHGWEVQGHPVFNVTPARIRKTFDLGSRASKEEVWEAFMRKVRVDDLSIFNGRDGDIADSVVLGYVAATAQRVVSQRDGQAPLVFTKPT